MYTPSRRVILFKMCHRQWNWQFISDTDIEDGLATAQIKNSHSPTTMSAIIKAVFHFWDIWGFKLFSSIQFLARATPADTTGFLNLFLGCWGFFSPQIEIRNAKVLEEAGSSMHMEILLSFIFLFKFIPNHGQIYTFPYKVTI